MSDLAPTLENLQREATALRSEKQRLANQYNGGMMISNKEYGLLSDIISVSTDPEKDATRFAMAKLYSQNADLDLGWAYQNIDMLNEERLGRKGDYTPTTLKALADSFEISKMMVKRNELGLKFHDLDVKHLDTKEIADQIKEYDEKMAELEDSVPRNFFTKWVLKPFAGSLPYMGDILLKGAMFGAGVALTTTGIGAAAGVPMLTAAGLGTTYTLASLAYGAAATAYGWKRVAELSKGEMYYNLRQQGVEQNVAEWASSINGWVQGAVENFLGMTPMATKALTNALGREAAAGISSRVIAKMYGRGLIDGLAAGAINWIEGAGEEGLEELLQSIADNITEYTVSEISDSGYTFDKTALDVLKEAVTEGAAGFGSALLLGAGPSMINTRADIGYSRNLKNEAELIPSKEMFIRRHQNDEQFSELTAAQRKDTLGDIYDRNHTIEGVSNAEAANLDTDYLAINESADEEESEAQATDTPQEPIKRRKDHRLHTQESTTVTENADGSESHTLKLGSADSRRRYGRIEFTVNGDTVTIDNVYLKAGQEALTGEFVTELMRRYEGYNIEWQPTTESQIKVRDQLIKDNRENPGQLQMFKGRNMDEVLEAAGYLKEKLPNLNRHEATVAAGLMRVIAEGRGRTLQQFIHDDIQFKTFAEAVANDVMSEQEAALNKGAYQLIENGTKAIIYVGKEGDFSTLFHEVVHFISQTSPQSKDLATALKGAADTDQFRQYLEQHKRIMDSTGLKTADDIINAIKEMSDNPMKWTRAQNEIVAVLGETYAQEGRTFNPELKSLFDKIIDFFMKIYRMMKQNALLNDDIVKAYDALLAGNPELKAQMEKGEQTEIAQGNGQVLMQGKPSAEELAEADRQYKEVEARYKGTSEWLKAPNGQPTKLTERQWVQVRTPAFKSWFGDWENDPDNASKVVDENGEPKVVYHGTETEGFDTFAINGRTPFNTPQGTVWFTEDRLTAQTYSGEDRNPTYKENGEYNPAIYSTFLNIRNPYIYENKTDEYRPNTIAEEALQSGKYDGVIFENAIYDWGLYAEDLQVPATPRTDYVAFYPEQIKSATDNIGTFSQSNPSILFQRDAEYEEAVKSGDIEKAQAMLAEEAERKGYSADSDYQGSLAFNGSAPSKNGYYNTKEERKEAWDNNEYEGAEFSLGDFVDNKIDTYDLEWTLDNPIPASGRDPNTLASIRNLASAVKSKKRTIKMYRAVDSDIKENSFRNGDWITPSKEYAKKHITLQDWKKGRVIEQEVSIDDIWWNGDDINEWGYDDGKGYVYKNTPNNRKLFEITYDENGNLIPLSQRFNESNPSILFQIIGERGAKTLDMVDEGAERINNLNVAREMEEAKKDASTIKQATGWERGKDGLWRYEIPDGKFKKDGFYTDPNTIEYKELEKKFLVGSLTKEERDRLRELNANLNGKKQELRFLSDYYDAPGLYAVYPKLKGVFVRFETMDRHTHGSYDPESDTITLNNSLDEKQMESTLIHEIQHAIQHIEGFARGGSVEEFAAKRNWANKEIDRINEKINEVYSKMKTISEYDMNADKQAERRKLKEQYNSLLDERSKYVADIVNLPFETYNRLAGEVEARNVQQRIGLSRIERMNKLLAETEDVAREDQIVLMNGATDAHSNLMWQGKTQQEIEDSLIADAKGQTLDEWLDFNRFLGDSNLDEAALTAIWEKANHVTEVEGEKVVEAAPLSEEEKDAAFRAMIDTDDGVRKFIQDLRSVDAYIRDIEREGMSDEEDMDFLNRLADASKRIETEAAPFIKNLLKNNNELSEESIKKVRGMVERNLAAYRDLYAAASGNENLTSNIEALPFIDEPTRERMQTMSIAEKRRLVDNLEAQELKKKILKGEELYEGEAEKVVKMLDAEIQKLEGEKEALKASLDNKQDWLDIKEKKLLNAAEEAKATEKAINKLERNIRSRLDKGMRISKEDYQKLAGWKDKLELLQDDVNALNKQTKLKAILQEREKYRQKQAELKQKQKERQFAKKVHDYKVKLASYIMKKPSKTVNWEQAEQILALQAVFGRTSGYDNFFINMNGKRLNLTAFRGMIDRGEINIAGLTDYQLKRYFNKSLAEYTVQDLETLADTVRYLTEQGRHEWQAKVDQRAFEASQWQNLLINEIAGNPRYTDAGDEPLPETGESEKKKRTFAQLVRTGWYKTLNMARKAQILDGNRKATAYRLLVEEKRAVQEREYEAIRKRMKPVTELMEKLGVKAEDFYEMHTLKIGKNEQHYTTSQLIYGLKAQLEQRNMEAFVYGNLISQREKEFYGHNDNSLRLIGEARLDDFIKQAQTILAGKEKEMKVAEAIWNDWQDKDNFARLNRAAIDEYNMPVDPVAFYMPISRKDFNGTELAAKIADDLYNTNAGKGMTAVEKGMINARLTISPDHQMPVDMDYFKLWTDSVADQEHFIASNAYVRKLNRVFKALGSKDLQANIEAVYGQGMMKDINNYINEVANPNINTDTQGVNKFLSFLRGALYPAYLAFKSSSVILQMITSPAPFLREVGPVELAQGLIQMSLHPVETWKYVTELSAMMENRSMNPLIDEIEKAAQNYTDPKYKRLWHKIQETGTMGLEMADRWAVTAGWLAVFDKKKAEYEAQGMEARQAEREAVKYADAVVLETQPTGDKTELAPLFKEGGPAWKAFTQFQVSLNVIWNNLTYDVANSDFRNHEVRKAMGTLIGYALAGVILYSVQEGFDDDDDAEDIILKLLYGATTQYTSSIPLVSSNIDNIIRSKMTGEAWYSRGSQLYPGLDALAQGVATGNVDKLARAVGIFSGAPVSGWKEFEHSFYNRKKGEWRFYPKAFLGRREK